MGVRGTSTAVSNLESEDALGACFETRPSFSSMGSDTRGSRSPDVGLPPAALARHADLERRRVLARALHEPARPRARRITEQLEQLRIAIAQYRARAIVFHARLLELEAAGNDNVARLRKTLIESSVQIEDVARSLVDSPEPGTCEWNDIPTLPYPR